MSRLRFIEPEEASESTMEVFRKMVMVPNLFCVMANSDAVIDTFASHRENLKKYNLSARYREIISLAVSQYNNCHYCIAYHTANAVDGGILTHRECIEARRMASDQPDVDILLRLTKQILDHSGNVETGLIEAVKAEGFCDQDIIELIAIIALITQSNYTANLSGIEIDALEPPSLEALEIEHTLKE